MTTAPKRRPVNVGRCQRNEFIILAWRVTQASCGPFEGHSSFGIAMLRRLRYNLFFDGRGVEQSGSSSGS